MNIIEIRKKLKKEMTINGQLNKRFIHSEGVAKASVDLARHYNLDIDLEKVYIAGLLHDATKLIDDQTQKKMLFDLGYLETDEIMKSHNVWHGETGYLYVKNEYNIDDEEILNAIRYHIMGRANMTMLEKIVFVADYIEENRVGEVFEKAREIAYKNLNQAVVFILESQINYIKSLNQTLITQTLITYEYYKKQEDLNCRKK